MPKIKKRSFLKWAGSKYSLIDELEKHLVLGERLVEPFAGSGSVFLNFDYPNYLVSDINIDLINLFKFIQNDPGTFIQEAKRLFIPSHNTRLAYDHLRSLFNSSSDALQRSLLFIYLNRHGFNGLCRYNRSGAFNVPFGKISKPYFPEAELEYFSMRSQNVAFKHQSFIDTFSQIRSDDVVYCDPPYVALTQTAKFSSYTEERFGDLEQLTLAKLAQSVRSFGNHVFISNHDTSFSRHLYNDAVIYSVSVSRSISCKGSSRKSAAELIAHYTPIS